MVFDTVNEIATHIATKYVLPVGVSGALVDTVSLQRIKVQNFTNVSIDPSGIQEKYQDIIVDFASADVIEDAFVWASTVATSGGTVFLDNGTTSRDKLQLGDLTVTTEGKSQINALRYLTGLSKDTPTKLREMAQSSLDNLSAEMSYFKSNG